MGPELLRVLGGFEVPGHLIRDCVTRTRYLPIPLLTCRNGTH